MALNLIRNYNFHIFAKHAEFFSITALILLLPLCYFSQMAFPYHSPKSVLLEFFVVTIFCLSLLHIANRRQFAFQINALDFSVILRLLFLILLYLFIPKYGNGFGSIKLLVLLTTFYFLVQYALTNDLLDVERSIIFIGKSLVASAMIETIFITIEFFKTPSQPFINFSYDKPLIFGTFGNPNSVAIFLSACVPFLLLFVRNVRSKFWKTFIVLCFIWVLAMIILTKSRASWVALIFGMVVLFLPELFRYVKIINRKILFLLVIIIALLCSISIVQIFNMNIESVRGRLLVWQVSVDMIKSSPIIGLGYGNFAVQYLEYQGNFLAQPEHSSYMNNVGDVKQAHNEYLEVFAETGIIGFVFFASIVFSFIYIGFEIYRKAKDGPVDLKMRAFYSSGMIILVHSLFDSPLHVLPLYFLFFLNCSIMSVYAKINDTNNKSALFHSQQNDSKQRILKLKKRYVWRINPFGRAVLLFTSVVILFLGVDSIVGKIIGFVDWQKGIDSAQRENWGEAIVHYEGARKNIPQDGRLKFNLGAAFLNSGKPHEAIPYLEQSLLSFQDKNIFILLGFAYAEVNQNIKAENILKEFCRKLPNLLLPHLLLGKLYYENGRIVESQNQLEFVLTKSPKIKNDYAEEIKREAKVLMEKTKKQKEEKQIVAPKELYK